jgi:hypothetical protein
LIYIYHPFFLSETATRPRVATPDQAVAESLLSTLGGGAYSVRGDNKDKIKDNAGDSASKILILRHFVENSCIQ